MQSTVLSIVLGWRPKVPLDKGAQGDFSFSTTHFDFILILILIIKTPTFAPHLFKGRVRPKKSFGQNFLINTGVIERIVDHFDQHNHLDNVLEVGPGKGALTKHLLTIADINYKAVEADWEMVNYLQSQYVFEDDQLINADFLKFPLETVFDGEEYNVIGNFPYNISTQILFRVEKYRDHIPMVMGMFQREVAERIVSPNGSKVYGVISVLLQAFYDAKILFHVNPGSFFPAPKVTSSFIMMKRKENFTLPCDHQLFRGIVKASFNQRRKMLRNSIKSFITDESLFSHEMMTRRPEHISLEDYYTLTNIIQEQES